MKSPRKKKRPKPPKKGEERKGAEGVVEGEEERKKRVLEALVDAFSLSSIREASIAYDIAGCDLERASEILRKGLSEDSFSCCSSSCSGGSSGGGTSSSSSSGMDLGSKEEAERNCGEGVVVGGFKGGKQKKKVVASTGTVSTVLGKEYVRRNKGSNKGFSANDEVFDMEKAEQFLCSMLGEDCDLNLAVVRDVLCQCGYDIERASNVLLDLAGSTIEKSSTGRHPNYRVDNVDDGRVFVDPNDSLIERRSESTSISSDGDMSDNIWSLGSFGRKYAEVLSNSMVDSSISSECAKSDIPQKVLESLFNFPKSAEHDKDSMNWRNVVKKIQSLGPGFNVSPLVAESQQRAYGGLGACHPRQPESEQGGYIMHFWQDYLWLHWYSLLEKKQHKHSSNACAKRDEYHVFREDSNQQWDSVKSYYKKAATAYSKGDRSYAAYLSDQGKEQTKQAQKADTRASHDIFVARNKGIENVITIDLHGQHVKPAMRMLKLHLLFGSYVPSVQRLRVITGCGSHGFGKSKLKQSVIELLQREAIEWREENQGTVLIKLSGWREYRFVDTNSDSDSTD